MNDRLSQWVFSGLACWQVAAGTSDLLDGRPSTRVKMRIALHLVTCADCRAHLRQVALVRDTLARLPKKLPSPLIRLRLRRQFAAQHPH